MQTSSCTGTHILGSVFNGMLCSSHSRHGDSSLISCHLFFYAYVYELSVMSDNENCRGLFLDTGTPTLGQKTKIRIFIVLLNSKYWSVFGGRGDREIGKGGRKILGTRKLYYLRESSLPVSSVHRFKFFLRIGSSFPSILQFM